jgi:RNA polymerase sigma-70 factor (ECF subfamily)
MAFEDAIDTREHAYEAPALEELFRDHADSVFRLIHRLLGPGATRADVEDLTQQAFLAAHRALPKFRGECKASSWLHSIAARTVYREIRTRGRQRKMVFAYEAMLAAVPQQSDAHDRLLEQRQELARVWRCLMKISAKKRMVYVLHDLEQLSGREIADMLEVNEATVHSRLRHARKELMELLEKEAR